MGVDIVRGHHSDCGDECVDATWRGLVELEQRVDEPLSQDEGTGLSVQLVKDDEWQQLATHVSPE